MGFLGRFKRKQEQPTTFQPSTQKKEMTEADIQIMNEALEKGTPCVLFIPVDALRQSMTVVKPEGLKGFFIARVPALYEDGTIRYLYKEEFMLLLSVQGAISQMEDCGRTYFFLGVHQAMELSPDKPYLDPRIFYQNNNTLFDVEFAEEMEFFRFNHSPDLEVTYIRADHNVKVSRLGGVNFLLAAYLHTIEERDDPSAIFQYYEHWQRAQYPTSGDELRNLLNRHVQGFKDLFDGLKKQQ